MTRSFRMNPSSTLMNPTVRFLLWISIPACLLTFASLLIVPDENMPRWASFLLLGGILAAGCVMPLMIAGVTWAMRGMRVELADEGLRLHASPAHRVGRLFPWSSSRIGEARLATLRKDFGLRPWYNSRGCLGETRLNNGHKALAFILDESTPFVHLPTTEGIGLMIQLESPEAFLELLHDYASVPGR